jgi:hypothetical protein
VSVASTTRAAVCKPTIAWLGALVYLALSPAAQLRAEPSAVEWLERSQAARFPGRTMVASFRLEIFRADGSTFVRRGKSYRASRSPALADRLVVITDPPSIAGLALLSKDAEGGPADQWLYLPAYRRARRVAVHGAGDAFVGSDFYYADLARVRTDAGEHSLGGTETIEGRECVVVRSRILDAGLPYGRVETLLDRSNALPLRVRYYDRDGTLLRVAALARVESVGGRATPLTMTMRNVETGGRSELTLDRVEYEEPLADDLFSIERLERDGPPN